MKLNRNNYEEYFILYLDNELGSDGRREVEFFAQENPDLKAELDILLQSKLTPDTDVTFSNKEILMAPDNSSAININNYEEWLLSYTDNELTTEERKEVERFIAGHPVAKTELDLFQQTKLQSEIIIFHDKELLYRKEGKVRVVAIRWWRLAAAAVLLIAVSTTAIILLNNHKPGKDQGGFTAAKLKVEKSTNNNVAEHPENITPEKQEKIAPTDLQQPEDPIKEPDNGFVVKKEKNTLKEKKQQLFEVTPQEAVVVKNIIDKKPDNNLPKPDFNPNINGSQDKKQNEVVAIAEPPAETLTNPDKKTNIGAVTASALETSDPIEQPTGKKNKLRGFFRKVTRTFEKRTNIKATDDDDDRLLIAGLAIKLN